MINETEISKLKFEEALEKLEQLVKRLDDGDLNLEESILYYESGMKLKEHCENLIKNAELKISKITNKEKIEVEKLRIGDDEANL